VIDETEAGHGFGLSEVVTVVVTISTGVASDVVAGALREALGKVIRRAKGKTSRGDGSIEGLSDLVAKERVSKPSKDTN
jgi:hypothetical protein